MTGHPQWRKEGWREAGGGLLCPKCGLKVSKNALARARHQGSDRCVRRQAMTQAERNAEEQELR
jgi:hypothetical protein